jgi:hypothetical protein
MPKIVRIIGIIFSLSLCLYAGILNIRRATISKSDLTSFEDKVIGKAISYSVSSRHRSYQLEFKLENSHERIAINFPTKNEAYQDSTIYKIDTGKVYKFYLDKTYPTFLSKGFQPSYYLNKGVDIIEYDNVEVFY